MKKLFVVVILTFGVFLTGCGENNQGPFEKRREAGQIVLYSAGKPAKGWISTIKNLNDGTSVVISEIEYSKGVPTGKFKHYDFNNNLIEEGKLSQYKDKYKGTIDLGSRGKLEGVFNITPEWITSRQMVDLEAISKDANPENAKSNFVIDGKVNTPLFKLSYKKGEVDGKYEEYYENGKLRIKAKYKDGKRDGVSEFYYENGQLGKKTTYKNGKLEGTYEGYFKNGQLAEKMTFKNGKAEGNYEGYYENGQLGKKTTYKDGKAEGNYEAYFENGQLAEKATYKDGKAEGNYEEYHKNGQLAEKTTYKDGKRDGVSELYDENGKLTWKGIYENGAEKEYKRYNKQGKLIK